MWIQSELMGCSMIGRASKFSFACQHQVKQLRNYEFIVTCNEVVMSFSTCSRYSWHSVYLAASAVNNISDCEHFWHKAEKSCVNFEWICLICWCSVGYNEPTLTRFISVRSLSPAWLLAQQSFRWLVTMFQRRGWCCVWRPTTKSE